MAKKDLENTTGKRREWVTVNQDEIDAWRASPTFCSSLLISSYTNEPFFYFRNVGDCLEGVLGIQRSNSNIRRCASRLIATAHGYDEFFVNRQLSKLLKKHHLQGTYIRVTYIGSERTGFGHARKCYEVETFPSLGRGEKMTLKTAAPGTKTKRISKCQSTPNKKSC